MGEKLCFSNQSVVMCWFRMHCVTLVEVLLFSAGDIDLGFGLVIKLKCLEEG